MKPGDPQRGIAVDAPGQPTERDQGQAFGDDRQHTSDRRVPEPLILPGRDQAAM